MPLLGGIVQSGKTDGTTQADEGAIHAIAMKVAGAIEQILEADGLPAYSSPLLQTPRLFMFVDPQKFTMVHAPSSGMQECMYSRQTVTASAEELYAAVAQQKGWPVAGALFGQVRWEGDTPVMDDIVAMTIAAKHLEDVRRASKMLQVNLQGYEYLTSNVEAFLKDHPNFDRNVFLMMRFGQAEYQVKIHQTLKEALRERDYELIRADDKDYHDELWSNIVTQMLGCKYGVAVFEQIDEREFNPNVALEVGFMLARRQRVLLLKEKRVAALNADIIGKLYKPFDMMDISTTIGAQVARWADVDLA